MNKPALFSQTTLVAAILLSILTIFGCATQPAGQANHNAPRLSQAPFSKGVNLTDYFQKNSPGQIQFSPERMRKDLNDIKGLGCDVVRLPIRLHSMTNGKPDYILDPLFLEFLDQTIDIAEDAGIHIIIDNHTFDPVVETKTSIEKPLLKVWPQIARRYKNRSDLIHYEVLNEPHGISDAAWGRIQGKVIAAIRTEDTSHSIIVGPASWNSYRNLSLMPDYKDPNLIYTFHYCDPFIFTHQGASWTDPPLTSVAAVPFPFDEERMPKIPKELASTWIPNAFKEYRQEGTEAKVVKLLKIAADFQKDRGVALYCGEFGVYDVNSPDKDRTEWNRIVSKTLTEYGIAWTLWDYRDGFGIHRKGGGDVFEYDLNRPLVQSLGLTPPPTKKKPDTAETEGFTLYDDYLSIAVRERSYFPENELTYFAKEAGADGKYCIKWTEAGRYRAIRWDFSPPKNLAVLSQSGYMLQFRIKGNRPEISFDIRVLNSGAADGQIPWRLGKTIDGTIVPMDGNWQTVRIPLSELDDKGAWKDKWFPPEGSFNLGEIYRMEIVPESQELGDGIIWLDDIEIAAP